MAYGTAATQCRHYRNGAHTFDEISGWCVHGCGVRDDGRVVSRVEAKVIEPGPLYSGEELAYFRDRTARIMEQRKVRA